MQEWIFLLIFKFCKKLQQSHNKSQFLLQYSHGCRTMVASVVWGGLYAIRERPVKTCFSYLTKLRLNLEFYCQVENIYLCRRIKGYQGDILPITVKMCWKIQTHGLRDNWLETFKCTYLPKYYIIYNYIIYNYIYRYSQCLHWAYSQ